MLNLPKFILCRIALELSDESLKYFQVTCKRLSKIANEPYIWLTKLTTEYRLKVDPKQAKLIYEALSQHYTPSHHIRSITKLKPVRIPCRNSFYRRQIHNLAEKLGLSHRSIINYKKTHINQKITLISTGWGGYDDDRYKVKIYATPISYVEINGPNTKLNIGSKMLIPNSIEENMYSSSMSSRIANLKRKLKETVVVDV